MRDGMLRTQETSDALWHHLEELPDGGATLTIPRSKTDQTGEGAIVYLSPQTMRDIHAMRQSMRETGIEVSENGKIFRMSRNMVYEHIRTACYIAGLHGRFGGHSPRIGMTQTSPTPTPATWASWKLGVGRTARCRLTTAARSRRPKERWRNGTPARAARTGRWIPIPSAATA